MRVRRLLVSILLLPLLSGCFSGEDPAELADVVVRVVEEDGGAVAGAEVTLRSPDGTTTQTTGIDGEARFEAPTSGRCTVTVSAEGYLAKEANLPCGSEAALTLTLTALPPLPSVTPTVTGTATPTDTPAPTSATLYGTVLDSTSLAPISGAAWSIERDGSELTSGLTDEAGTLQATLEPGPATILVGAACREPLRHETDLDEDLALELHMDLRAATELTAPALTAYSGPGPGMVGLRWGPVTGAARYEVDDGAIIDVAGNLAWGDHTPAETYRVRAVDTCGLPGPWSAEASATPAPGGPLPRVTLFEPPNIETHQRTYPVLDAAGKTIGTQDWRIAAGTGNCCENYVSTTRQGWILDFGGSSLLFSKDEGRTWDEIIPHGFQVCGEGAVVPGPAGDIYAMNWEMCLGAGDDGVWSLKYVAADDTWIEGAGPVHSPFFDRPWMTVFPGPHVDAFGQQAPVRSYIFSNFNDGLYGAGHVVSGDGVLYAADVPVVDSAMLDLQELPTSLLPDPDMDWTQPIVQSYGKALDPGIGVVSVGLTLCQVMDTSDGRYCAGHDLPVRSMQRDGGGRLHAVDFESGFRYRWSDDVGRTWDEAMLPLPPGVKDILEWDLKAHHGLDRAVVAIHAEVDGGAQDYAIVLRGIRDVPVIDRVLQVGGGGGTAGSGVAETGQRYDFMTTGFLPDGRVVLSFTDGEFHPPAVAIELA